LSLENINVESHLVPLEQAPLEQAPLEQAPLEQAPLKSAQEVQQFLQELQVFRRLSETCDFLLPLCSTEDEERNEQEAFGNI